jgi:uncharacterized protein (UPF0335 family)
LIFEQSRELEQLRARSMLVESYQMQVKQLEEQVQLVLQENLRHSTMATAREVVDNRPSYSPVRDNYYKTLVEENEKLKTALATKERETEFLKESMVSVRPLDSLHDDWKSRYTQILDDNSKLQLEISRLNSQLITERSKVSKVDEFEKALGMLSTENEKLTKNYNDSVKQLETYKSSVSQLQTDNKKLKESTASFANEKSTGSDTKNLQSQITTLKAQLQDRSDQLDIFKQRYAASEQKQSAGGDSQIKLNLLNKENETLKAENTKLKQSGAGTNVKTLDLNMNDKNKLNPLNNVENAMFHILLGAEVERLNNIIEEVNNEHMMEMEAIKGEAGEIIDNLKQRIMSLEQQGQTPPRNPNQSSVKSGKSTTSKR